MNGLTPALLTTNPNSANPQRLTPAQALTCDQNHGYSAEQKAEDDGLMDKFVQFTNRQRLLSAELLGAPGLVMDYYDGNTVTGLWNYAQHYAMSDNYYDTDVRPVHPRRAEPDLRPDRRRPPRSTPRAQVVNPTGGTSAH